MAIVRCLADDWMDLAEHQRPSSYTTETQFLLARGSLYRVFGIGLFSFRLDLLVREDTGSPFWYPAGLFTLEDNRLPRHWEFAIFTADGDAVGWQARWGYPPLVHSEEYCNRLLEEDETALREFDAEELRLASDGVISLAARHLSSDQVFLLGEMIDIDQPHVALELLGDYLRGKEVRVSDLELWEISEIVRILDLDLSLLERFRSK
jgi:hypothetical protein